MKMKAAILFEAGASQPHAESRPLRVEVDLEGPTTMKFWFESVVPEALHSDLSVINASIPRALPMVMGHESSGEIVDVGKNVNDVEVGDHVVFQFRTSCGRCRRCAEGRPALCEISAKAKATGGLIGGGSRLSFEGKPISHHSGISCMAEYAVVDRGTVVVIDKELPLDEAAIFGCAVMTGVGAVANTARVRAGDDVVGLGGVGLNALLGTSGAAGFLAIDISDEKLGLARQLGATETYNASDEDCVQKIIEATSGASISPLNSRCHRRDYRPVHDILRTGGRVVAMTPPTQSSFSFKPAQLVGEERGILGSSMGSCVPIRDIPRYINLYRQGRLPVDRLIDARIGFDELNAGFDKLTDGSVVRQILVPHG